MNIGASDDLAGKLAAYAALVRKWSPRLDLVASGDLPRFEDRHIADSLRLLPLARSLPPGPAVDVGSGAGLPGIPLCIAAPARHWRLLEPRAKRAAFLEEVVRELGLTCEVVAATAEEAARGALGASHVLAAGRALAPPAHALELLRRLVRSDGVAAVFVGEDGDVPPEGTVWRPGIAIVEGPGPVERE